MPYIKDSWGSGSLRQPKNDPAPRGKVVPKPTPPVKKAKAKKTRRIVNQPMDNA